MPALCVVVMWVCARVRVPVCACAQWDALFVGMRAMGRDEGLLSFLIQMLLRFLMNLIFGVIMAVITFLWSVWSIIASVGARAVYGPHPCDCACPLHLVVAWAWCCVSHQPPEHFPRAARLSVHVCVRPRTRVLWAWV